MEPSKHGYNSYTCYASKGTEFPRDRPCHDDVPNLWLTKNWGVLGRSMSSSYIPMYG
jgi:hypothetical protein